MACGDQLVGAMPRISARTGMVVDLDVRFYQGGVLTDPFAIRFVEIYRSQVLPHNLVTTIPFVYPTDILYPAPACQLDDSDVVVDPCLPTEGSAGGVGQYHLPYEIPVDSVSPDVYFDVWYYHPTDPCADVIIGTTGTGGEDITDIESCDIDDEEFDDRLLRCCHRFWVYPNEWFCGDQLQTIRFGFEPLDQRFHYPEVRPLEVGVMPLPLYDYNFNLVNSMVPMLQPTISIETQSCELLVDRDVCRMGLRQGSYRTNPWVIQYDLNTELFLKGTYRYQITIPMPDGSSRVSRKFIFTID